MKKTISPFYKSMMIALCLTLMIYTVALAASGDLDSTFSGDGKIIQRFGGIAHAGYDVAVQTDGKIVVVGEKWLSASSSDFAIARYNTNGSLDTTFSGDGRQVVNFGPQDQALAIAIQTDGKIVVGGQTCTAGYLICDVAVARLNINGTLDTAFSGDGKVSTDYGLGDNGGFSLALQGSKIVVAGYWHDGTSYNAAVYRYNSNGVLDSTFSGDGILSINFGMDELLRAVTIYSGKIYVAGNSAPTDYSKADFIAARINTDGTLDATFSGDGKIKTSLGVVDISRDIAISGGKVVIVGTSDSMIGIVQYTASGALDTTFSGDGKLKSNLGFPAPNLWGVAIQAGKIVAVGGTDGNAGNALAVRYTAAGNLDTTFSGDGIVTTNWGGGEWYRSVVFKNSRLYVVGISRTTPTDPMTARFIVGAYLP